MQANNTPIKINNNYFNKFDYSKELNSNNQYFSTGLHNRPYLKLDGIELVNDIKTGDISAFRKYLAIRDAYHYYDDLLLLPLMHEDIRLKLIHNVLDNGKLIEVIDVIQTLTHNYNFDKFKEELKPKFFKKLTDMNEDSLLFSDRTKIDQWNEIVSSIFPENNELIVVTADELLSASRDGDIDAFNSFLKKYQYYKHSYDNLIDSIHNDIREELILLVANQDIINLDVLDVLTLDYDIQRIKDSLYSKLSRYSLKLKQRKPNEQWNDLVISLFGDSSDELTTSYDEWKQDVIAITDPYPKDELRLSAREYLDEHIESAYIVFNREVISDKFIGAYEYDNTKVWLYECKLLESKNGTTRTITRCYAISHKRPDFPLTLYGKPKKGGTDYRKIVIDNIKSNDYF